MNSGPARKGDRLLSITEVCERWGISRWTLADQLKNGTVRVRPAALVGKRLRWRESDVERDIATASISGDIQRARYDK